MGYIFLILSCASIILFSSPLPTAQAPQDAKAEAEVQTQAEGDVEVKAEADVDVYMIEETDGSFTPIVIADAKAEVKTTTRRKQMNVQACASVDVHMLENILPKKIGDVENILKTFYLYKTTAATAPLIQSDAPVCTNRYCLDSCCSVKWEYSVGQDYQIVSKLWGFDMNNFIYVQENINWLSAEHHIMKSVVTNVMKASAKNLVAEPSLERIDLVEYLDDVAYVILAAEWNTFVLFKTADKLDSITYVALTEEAYLRKDKSEIVEKVSTALKAHEVDEKSMKTFTKTFTVKTNSIKPKNQKP